MPARHSLTRAIVLGLSPLLGVTTVLAAPATARAASPSHTASTARARHHSPVARIVDLGTLGGRFSRITAVSDDGRWVVGLSTDATGDAEIDAGGDPAHNLRMFV